MKGLIQRVSSASVRVNGDIVGSIDQGLLLFLGVERQDTIESADKLLSKVLAYRMFADAAGKMNLSVQDIAGGLLIVSQFTLVADTKKGLRPSFSQGAAPEQGKALYDHFVHAAKQRHAQVQTGIFGADMAVVLTNDGPVTFLLEN